MSIVLLLLLTIYHSLAQWRDHGETFAWTSEYSNKLLTDVGSIKPPIKHDSYKPVLLMFGPTGHGKSCFINSISSISKERKSNICAAARQDTHVTTVFRKYEMGAGNEKEKLGNFVLADVRGVVAKDENKFLVDNVLQIVDGHVKPDYKFDCSKIISEDDEFYIANPTDSEKVHCVIFVFSCQYVDTLNQEYASSTLAFMKGLYHRDIPRIVILTHADLVTSSGLKNIFRSETIKSKVDFIRSYLGVPLENIHPVQNFDETTCGSTNLNKLVSIPLLLALQQALHFACDTIDKKKH